MPRPREPFVVLGVDPTAGTWASRMEEGPKPMASCALRWDGRALRLAGAARHLRNEELWSRCREAGARVLAVDGPCGTNGLALRADRSGWDARCAGGVRDAERALAREGFHLYWTTARTVARFDGASRWIARSLRLFSDPAAPPGLARIEVYPQGAFAALWRAGGRPGRLARKTRPEGREARLRLLAEQVEGIAGDALPDHDAVDAALAALVGALWALGRARAVGTEAGGGRIWMPALEPGARLRAGPPRRIPMSG